LLLAELTLAVDVVRDSGPAALLVILVIALAALAVMAVSVQVAAPGAPFLSCLAATSQVNHRDLQNIMRAVAAPVATMFAIGAVVLLFARDHVAGNTPALSIAWIALAGAAASIAILKGRAATSRSATLARRIPHLVAATLAGELLLAAAVTTSAWAICQTAGASISPLEAFAAVVIARALTFLPWLPAGAPVADVAMALTLHAIGAPTEAAIATVLLWRLALGLAATGTRIASRVPATNKPLPEAAAANSNFGDHLHRFAFRVLSMLPPFLARFARRTFFDAIFRLSKDPWQYDTEPYERRKRETLLQSMPPNARIVVEVGCAEGHNLRALAHAMPSARIIGIDVSRRAVEIARARAAAADLSIEVLQTDVRSAHRLLQENGVTKIDLLVIAETLYYLGGPEKVAAELQGLRPLLADDASIVLLHPARDAEHLHAAALGALGVTSCVKRGVEDPERPYLVEVATRNPAHVLID
jgi:SAM-dependent methyltransferase